MKKAKLYKIVLYICAAVALVSVFMWGFTTAKKKNETAINSASVMQAYNLEQNNTYEYRQAELFDHYDEDGGTIFRDYEDFLWLTMDCYDLPNGTPCILLMEKPDEFDVSTWKICGVWFQTHADGIEA